MAVLLEGINIPEGNPITINIYRDGTWVNAYTAEDGNAIEAQEPHGRLIDADALLRYWESLAYSGGDCELYSCMADIRDAPTIIPASVEIKT